MRLSAKDEWALWFRTHRTMKLHPSDQDPSLGAPGLCDEWGTRWFLGEPAKGVWAWWFPTSPDPESVRRYGAPDGSWCRAKFGV